MFSNGGGGAVYDFCEQRFVITNDAFNYNGYNSDYAASEVIELKPGTKYEVKSCSAQARQPFSLTAKKFAIPKRLFGTAIALFILRTAKLPCLTTHLQKKTEQLLIPALLLILIQPRTVKAKAGTSESVDCS